MLSIIRTSRPKLYYKRCYSTLTLYRIAGESTLLILWRINAFTNSLWLVRLITILITLESVTIRQLILYKNIYLLNSTYVEKTWTGKNLKILMKIYWMVKFNVREMYYQMVEEYNWSKKLKLVRTEIIRSMYMWRISLFREQI